MLVAILTAVAALSAWRLYSTAENRYVREAFPIRSSVRDLLIQMLDEETGVRGYIITADRPSLQPYEQAQPGIAADLADLTRLTARRPEIAADVATARVLIRQLNRYYVRQIALVRQGDAGQARAQQNVFAGTALFDRYRRVSAALLTRSNAIVESAQNDERRTLWTTLAIAIAAGVSAAAIALWLLLSVPRRIWSLYDVERDLREAAERGSRASRSLAHVDDAVVLLDPDGTVRYWNPAATRIFGVDELHALDRPIAEVVPEFDALEQVLERGAVAPITRNGTERWLAVRQSRFDEGRVLVLEDTTSERQLERARSDFLATASHELRTPLAAVYGAVRTLRHGNRAADPELERSLLEMIESESDRLKEIVEQILISAEVDRGEIHLRSEVCDLRALCRTAIEAARVRVPPGFDLILDAPSDVVVDCDAAKLRQVVVNLLDNAIKYSPDGGTVTVSLRSGPTSAFIAVRDEGIGVPTEAQERIFEKFFRLDAEMSRGVGGSGLGLYISRELMRRMGGELRVRSDGVQGSSFTAELPR